MAHTASVWAASGTEGASFLDIPVGGRPAALGGAYSALAYDAYAPVMNPAGLGFVERSELAGQHLSYLDTINYEYASFVHPMTVGHSLGVAIQYLRPGDLNGTDVNGNSIGTVSGSYAAYSVAYGQTLTDRLAVGVSGKLIRGAIGDYTAHAYGLDAGALYSATERLTFAAMVANVGTHLTFIDQKDSLPLAGRVGAAYFPINSLALTAQGEYAKTGLLTGRFGVEVTPVRMISLRAGYKTDTTKELSMLAGFSTGVGLHLFGQEFDYAWVPLGDLGNTQYFSLVLRWGEAERAKRNLIRYAHRRDAPAPDPEGFWSVYNFDEHVLPPDGTQIAQPQAVPTPESTR